MKIGDRKETIINEPIEAPAQVPAEPTPAPAPVEAPAPPEREKVDA